MQCGSYANQSSLIGPPENQLFPFAFSSSSFTVRFSVCMRRVSPKYSAGKNQEAQIDALLDFHDGWSCSDNSGTPIDVPGPTT